MAVTEQHISGDGVIDDGELQNIEKLPNDHTAQIARALILCSEQGLTRTNKANKISNVLPPLLRSLRKDHKKVPEERRMFSPPSRPVGDGNNAPDTQLSWLLASICQRASWDTNTQTAFI